MKLGRTAVHCSHSRLSRQPFGDDADNLFGVDLVGDLGDGDEVEEGEKEGEETAL